MKQKFVKIFFLLSLFVPLHGMMTDGPRGAEKNSIEQICNELVYIGTRARNSIVAVAELLPDQAWSTECKNLCLDIKDEGNVALYCHVAGVVDECLAACTKLPHDQSCAIQFNLQEYKEKLEAGEVHLINMENETPDQTQLRDGSSKVKKICKLCVNCLAVTGHLFVGDIDFSNLSTLAIALRGTGLIGATGPTGATGAPGTGTPGATGATGATGTSAITAFSNFFALMPPDNASTVAIGGDVDFPQDGPTSGTIARTGVDTFNLPAIGTYEITWQVSVTEAGQLVLTLNGAELPNTVVGRATGTSQIMGSTLITTSVINSILTVRNPSANSTALTITPLAGGADSVSATLTIKQIA